LGHDVEVLAIVLVVKKRFLQAEKVFRSLTLSSRHLLAWTITMTSQYFARCRVCRTSYHS